MAEAVMTERCPGHSVLGVAELPGHRFAFSRRSIRTGTGVADVVADTASSVWGVLYEIDDLAALDAKEGAGWAYVHCEVDVRMGEQMVSAVTYKVKTPEPTEIEPARDYIDGIIEAARSRGLPTDYVGQLERKRSMTSSA